MQLIFEFWGPLERRAGRRESSVTLGAGAATLADALVALGAQLPDLADALDRAAVAEGDRLLARNAPVHAGMRLALLPPVAGG